MGGAIGTVAKAAANVFMTPVNAAASAGSGILDAVTGKGDLGDIPGKTIRGTFNPVIRPNSYGFGGIVEKKGAGNKDEGILPGKAGPDVPDVPSIIAADPAAVAADAKKQKEAARRKAEIDILTDQPGRGGVTANNNFSIVN